MPRTDITIRGAREHNLKNLTLTIPRDKLVVFTGVSGSGKSSLAFDTLYAEGQRRYVESLSAYARQFLDQMEKPNVELIEGLSPAIAIEQKTASRNPRSTVATVTEIHDYMRVLWARCGIQHCHQCGKPISSQTPDQMVDRLMALDEGTRLQILAPVVLDRKGEYAEIFDEARRDGYARVRVDGQVIDLTEEISLSKRRKHRIEIVVDRVVVRPQSQARLAESMETALKLGDGMVLVDVIDSEELLFSQHAACSDCGISFGPLEPQMFSFNAPQGMCPECSGMGTTLEMDETLVVTDPDRSLSEGAIELLGNPETQHVKHVLEALHRHFGVEIDRPFRELPPEQRRIVLQGSPDTVRFRYRTRNGHTWEYSRTYDGILSQAQRRFINSQTDEEREELGQFLSDTPCPACKGGRLKPQSAAVRIADVSLCDVSRMCVRDAAAFFAGLDEQLSGARLQIAEPLLKEIGERLQFMVEVGLQYLTLDRSAPSLSGGEAQRIRLATQIGSRLMGCLYILDEPSIGLHARDNRRLLDTLLRLRDLGNTVVVVEHDEETILSADHIVDFGPGAGTHGGHVVASGSVADVLRSEESVTGQYLSGRRRIPRREARREPRGWLTVHGARENNLRAIEVGFPIGAFTCVTGVSGSGKSTLVCDVLLPALYKYLNRARVRPGAHDSVDGLEHLDRVIHIDQQPIGRTPRSNPATYTGLFGPIRETFAQLPESRLRGYRPGRFSFNVKGGRCEACQGDGLKRIEMLFLPDVYVTCESCKGKRFNRETLQVRYKGASIAEVLDMTVDDALELFRNLPRIARHLETLQQVGLGYIHLGQSATTLSGGEAQRIKLARELGKRATGRTLYILDEPTTGLHFADIEKLLAVLHRLADAGNTIVVIEHNMEVIRSCDYIVDLGPEGGDDGGLVVCAGTPEQVAAAAGSHTGRYLRQALVNN